MGKLRTAKSENKTSFTCLNCHAVIPKTSIGTRNRNHCPHCLWSKHLDLKTPGDRQSACGGGMRPTGLKSKNGGELMVVHICVDCGKVSYNRTAGDDDPHALISLLEEASKPDVKGVNLLTQKDRQDVMTALYGHSRSE